VDERYFTPAEVEALIPALTRVLDDLIPAHAGASEVGARLHAEQTRVTLSGGAVIDRAEWRDAAARLEALTARVKEGLAEIARMGGVPKDLSMGLIDFLHRRQDDVVNLCWKYGEREIRYWHGLDEGYAMRKPL
jgi:hypothetical protein